jgi:hypothetical protein
VRRGIQQQQTGRANAQDLAHFVGRRAAQEWLQHRIERGEAAQHGGGDAMPGGAVARLAGGKQVQGFVERVMPLQNLGQQKVSV